MINDDGTHKVEVFDLKLDHEKKQYEDLMNNPDASIYKEEFSYVKTGDPKVTVWYLLEEA
jgi:hypothetical protein